MKTLRRLGALALLAAAVCPGLWGLAGSEVVEPSDMPVERPAAESDTIVAVSADSTAEPVGDTDASKAAKTANRRRINPIRTASAETQAINLNAGDTAYENAKIRARSTHYHRDDGYTVYVDTITGEEWIDSASHVSTVPKMIYPLLNGASLHVDIWEPLMRAFGQKYGLIGFGVKADLHNRYFPVFEMGFGTAHKTPDDANFTYRSPLSIYFKVGVDYNFLYNSNPDYKWFAGLRFGYSPFSWSVDNVHLDSPYWGEDADFSLTGLHSSAMWFELCTGLQVKLWGPVSAGWLLRYHSIIHESANPHGQPWYIPGYGARGGALTGSIIITYEVDLGRILAKHRRTPLPDDGESSEVSLPDVPEPGLRAPGGLPEGNEVNAVNDTVAPPLPAMLLQETENPL